MGPGDPQSRPCEPQQEAAAIRRDVAETTGNQRVLMDGAARRICVDGVGFERYPHSAGGAQTGQQTTNAPIVA